MSFLRLILKFSLSQSTPSQFHPRLNHLHLSRYYLIIGSLIVFIFIFYVVYYQNLFYVLDALYSKIRCITCSYLLLYFLKLIYRPHAFCLYFTFILFPLLITFLFFEPCGFSSTLPSTFPSGGITFSLYFHLQLRH